jgi:hypothetical protein
MSFGNIIENFDKGRDLGYQGEKGGSEGKGGKYMIFFKTFYLPLHHFCYNYLFFILFFLIY